MITALLLSAVTMTANPAAADDGWLAWIGCWRAQGDASSSMLCVVPADNGVRMVTLNGGSIQSETRVIADGLARHVEREGCAGTESAVWSKDDQRVFLKSDLTCGKVHRVTSGIMSMQTQSEWLNVEAVSAGSGQTMARTVRYVAAYSPGLPADIQSALNADKLARETARYAATAPTNLDDVKEAARIVDEHAVTEWLTAMNQQFDLTGKKLVALADAGVSQNIIETLVGISNPQIFAVRVRDDRDDRYGRRAVGVSSCYDAYYDPWSPVYYGSYYNNSYYCRGGYYGGGYWGGYYGGWYPAASTVVVVKDDGTAANPRAKVTREGYTRGTTSTSAHDTPRTGSTPTQSSSGNRPADGGGSGSSGGGSSTRTAHPRNGN